MFTTFDSEQQFDSSQSLKKEFTLETTVEELEREISNPESVVNSRMWQNIPVLLRDTALIEEKNIQKLNRLIQSILQILNGCLMSDFSLINRCLLHSSLSTFAKSPNLPKMIRVGVGQCLVSLDSFEDGPFMLVETDEFKSMEEAILHNTQLVSRLKEENDQLSHTITTHERQHKEEKKKMMKEKKDVLAEMEAMLTKEREEKRKLEKEADRAIEREQASEIAIRESEARIEQLLLEKQNAENHMKESKKREKRAEGRENQANADRREAEQSRKKMTVEKKEAEEGKRIAETEKRKMTEGRRMAHVRQRQAEEQKGQAQRDKEKLEDEVKRKLEQQLREISRQLHYRVPDD